MRAKATILTVLVAVAAALLSAPAGARAADCSLADQAYNGVCGPQFQLPDWGDGGGWTDPSKYTTIQLADLTGNGVDELIARNDAGLEIWWFDTKVGQWRPAIGADGRPEILTDFRTWPQSFAGPSFRQPQYYKTIQTAKLDGPDHGADILARFPGGMAVYHYTPPAGTKDINGGTWKQVSQGGPFSDKDGNAVPSRYLSIHASGRYLFGNVPCEVPQDCLEIFEWTGSGWASRVVISSAPHQPDPSLYLDITPATLPVRGASGLKPAIVSRRGSGIGGFANLGRGNDWVGVGNSGTLPFSDATGFGTSPSYYETLRAADIAGGVGDAILGRLSDGLKAYRLDNNAANSWQPLATLTDLKGTPQELASTPGRWASIRTGDILGNKRDQVLALDGTALQAWSYDPNTNSWTKLPAAVPLNLGGKLWDTDASYYSTIQVGDVTGDGHDAVVARGPYGIRTWFYCAAGDKRTQPCSNLNGKSGWTSWMPQDTGSYPQFSGGEAKAFATLTALAKQKGLIGQDATSVRDAWTGTNAPSTDKLNDLQSGLVLLANCSGQTSTNPPKYTTCTPPSGSDFSTGDWTNVANEVFAEIYSAKQVLDFFSNLNDLRRDTFLAKGAELPAIASSVKELAGAAGNETSIDPKEIFRTSLSIAGSLLEGVPGAGTALHVASELIPFFTSPSESVTARFDGTYADLQQKFATAITEADKALIVQSAQVRQSFGLLKLIEQLTAPDGAWAHIDYAGLKSSMNEGFALWAYKQLLPTIFTRYKITGCRYVPGPPARLICDFASSRAVVGTAPDFTTLETPPGGNMKYNGWPCWAIAGGNIDTCKYDRPISGPLADRVWGSVSDTCQYNGKPETVWTFGCNLGVNPGSSTDAALGPVNGWNFITCVASPVIYGGDGDSVRAHCSPSGAAAIGSHGSVEVSASAGLPRGFAVRGATLDPERLLYAPRLGGARLLRGSGRPLAPIPLKLVLGGKPGAGKTVLRSPAGQPPAQLTLKTTDRDTTTFDLTLRGVDVAAPSDCEQLPSADSMRQPRVMLENSFEVSDGQTTRTFSRPIEWQCVRDAAGNITQLRAVNPPPPAQRPGLAVRVAGPGKVIPGRKARYTVRVRNTRSGPRNRTISSLWHLFAQAQLAPAPGQPAVKGVRPQAATRHFGELRRGRSKTLRIAVRIPGKLRPSRVRRVCLSVFMTADSARPATARVCARVVRRGQP